MYKDCKIDNKIIKLNDAIVILNNKNNNLNILNKFCDNLHGSGINFEWKFTEVAKHYRLSNGYHCIDEFGMYDHIIDFTVRFKKTDLKEISIIINGYHSHNANPRAQIKDYLYDCAYYALEKSITEVRQLSEIFANDPYGLLD